VPVVPSLAALLLEITPVRPDGLLCQLLTPLDVVCARPAQVEKAGRHVKWIPRADDGNLIAELFHEWQDEGKVRFLDPAALVSDAFALEAGNLQAHIRRKLHHHVRSSGDARDILEVLAHEGVTRARIGSIDYGRVVHPRSAVSRLGAEKVLLRLLISLNILRPH